MAASGSVQTAGRIAARVVPVAVVFLGTMVAFEVGVDVSERPGVPQASWSVQLYYAVGLFVLGGMDLGVPVGGPVWARALLWLCYFLGPAITTTTIAEGVLRMTRPTWLIRLQRRDHLVVIGEDRLSQTYVTVVERTDPGQQVLLVSREHVRRTESRQRLCLDKARAVVVASHDDLANLDLAWELAEKYPRPNVSAHVTEMSLRRGAQELATSSNVRIFNAQESAAIALFDQTIATHFKKTESLDVVALLGFGRFGQTLLRHIQEHAPGEVSHALIVDRQASRLLRLYTEHVALDTGCEVIPIDADVLDPETWDQIASQLRTASSVPIVVLCTDKEAINLQSAVGLQERCPNAKIFVRIYNDSAFVQEFERRYKIDGFAMERVLHQALDEHWRSMKAR